MIEVNPEQAFTRPLRALPKPLSSKNWKNLGIGRPSTYAAIMNKIQSRDYTIKEKGTLKPTELGKVIAQMLEDNFAMIMDVGFTAAMEDELEHIAENQTDWKDLISEFWKEFIPTVETAEKEAFVPRIVTDLICPECGHKLQKIWSRKKYFYGCSNYPDCDFTAPLKRSTSKKKTTTPLSTGNKNALKCEAPMKLRFGSFGPFLGCTQLSRMQRHRQHP